MKLKIEMDLDNDSLKDTSNIFTGINIHELQTILNNTAYNIATYNYHNILDSNGNTIGKWNLTN